MLRNCIYQLYKKFGTANFAGEPIHTTTTSDQIRHHLVSHAWSVSDFRSSEGHARSSARSRTTCSTDCFQNIRCGLLDLGLCREVCTLNVLRSVGGSQAQGAEAGRDSDPGLS